MTEPDSDPPPEAEPEPGPDRSEEVGTPEVPTVPDYSTSDIQFLWDGDRDVVPPFTVRLNHGPISQRSIPLALASDFLRDLRSIAESIANDLRGQVVESTGRFRSPTESRLDLAGVSGRASVTFAFVVAGAETGRFDLDDPSADLIFPMHDAIREIARMVAAAASQDTTQVAATAQEVHGRAVRAFGNLVGRLGKQGIDSLWQVEREPIVALSPEAALTAAVILQPASESIEADEVTINGWLFEANTKLHAFTIEPTSGADEISGTYDSVLDPVIRPAFDQVVRARLRRTRTTMRWEVEPRNEWELLEILSVDGRDVRPPGHQGN